MKKGKTMKMSTLCVTILAAAVYCGAFAAQGAAMMECGGLVTEKVAGWRFEASGAKGEDEAPL